MAHRLESIAPPAGGGELSASTARLVKDAATLGESQWVQIKGSDEPVVARRLLGTGAEHSGPLLLESTLVGRKRVRRIGGIARSLDRWTRVGGWCGRSCWYRQDPTCPRNRAAGDQSWCRGVLTFCESHAADVPYGAVARLLRAASGVSALDDQTARGAATATIPTPIQSTCSCLITSGHRRSRGGAAEDRPGCTAAAVDHAHECYSAGLHPTSGSSGGGCALDRRDQRIHAGGLSWP